MTITVFDRVSLIIISKMIQIHFHYKTTTEKIQLKLFNGNFQWWCAIFQIGFYVCHACFIVFCQPCIGQDVSIGPDAGDGYVVDAQHTPPTPKAKAKAKAKTRAKQRATEDAKVSPKAKAKSKASARKPGAKALAKVKAKAKCKASPKAKCKVSQSKSARKSAAKSKATRKQQDWLEKKLHSVAKLYLPSCIFFSMSKLHTSA